MTIRDIDRRLRNLDSSDTTTPTPLSDSLLENVTFNYAHLVKFERPTTVSIKGKTSRKANIYSYITDSAFDVEWDDLSIDAGGTANGTQNYHANKVSKVGSVTETTEAKSTNMSLSLDASGLGASATSLDLWLSATEIHAAVGIDLREEGFREGDKIHITTSNGNINTGGGIYVTIDTFKSNGNHITYTLAQTASITTGTAMGSYKISLAAEEINALVINKDTTAYKTYLNREVFIYKAHLDSDTNAIIGDPYLLFKGIISNGQIKESPDKSSTVTWGLSSHWGDFQRVAGRLTIDESHRSLDGAGNSDANNTLRPEYAGDLGFAHANQALNVMALYNDVEISYKQVDINGGWPGGKRLKEVETTVQKRVDLSFNLSPKYLPVIYGVQKTDAIPIFVDTDQADASKLTVVYAICEGPISGLFDIYIDGNSSICVDQADFDARSTASPAVDLVCRGRMDRGDTFRGHHLTSSTITIMGGSYELWGAFGADFDAAVEAYQQSEYYQTSIQTNATAVDADTGMLHEQTHTITSPLTANFQIHVGKPDQQANPRMVAKANANGFKIQNSYYTDTDPYWGAQHRLLDTAYVVGEFTIGVGETSVPELDFVVRGKGVKCYNYDRSYNQTNATSAAPSQFKLGDTVTLIKTSNNATIASGVTIIDKWILIDPEGVSQTRFRTDHNADITEAHYMKSSNNSRWYMSPETTTGQVEGTVVDECKTTISSSSSSSTGSGVDVVVAASTPFSSAYAAGIGGEGGAGNISFSSSARLGLRASTFNNVSFANNTFTGVGVGTAVTSLNSTITEVHMKNGIVLASGDSAADDFYKGYKIVLKHFDSAGVPNIQERDIIEYKNSGNVAVVNAPWDPAYLPTAGSKYFISDFKTDVRVSTNPALQLLDYLTSPLYGRGLDLEEDIDLQSFLQSARLCDTRSTVSVAVLSSQISNAAVGAVYQYAPSGVVHFRGTIQSITSVSAGSAGNTAYKEVVFSNVIGKLGHRDNNWKTRRAHELVWNPLNGRLYKTTSSGVYTIVAGNRITSFSLGKVSGTGPTNLALDLVAPTSHYNPLVKSWKATVGAKGRFEGSGYALYDSDDVKYWKYLGWDKHEQRNVTRHQMNQIVTTSSPIFDNINNMLKQFNGILRYSNGKYQLDIKGQSPDIFVVGERIYEDDIIGDISLKDAGIKKSYNSISTSIKDPATKFESRSVSFFNSTYLNEDKFIPKKGTFGMPGVTNYFNARYNINQMLDESRYGLSVSFKMMPKGLLLLPGSIIQLNYPRFGWVNKEFRISSHITQSDCLVSITADEHNNSAYLIKNVSKPTVGSEIETGSIQNKNDQAALTNFTSNTKKGNVELTWTNSSQFDPQHHITEVWRHTSASPFSSAELIGETTAQEWQAVQGNTTATTRYYWVRHVAIVRSQLASIESSRRNNSPLVGATTGSNTIDVSVSGLAGVSAAVIDGGPGANGATLSLYRKNTSDSVAPAEFSGTFTYTFATGAVTGGTLNSWTTIVPSLSNGEYAWVRQATASSSAATDSIPTSEFSAAVVHSGVGENGQSITGAAGNANALVGLYRVSSSDSAAPNDPTGTLVYNFASGLVTESATAGGNLNSWTRTVPTVPQGSFLWIIQATASSNTGSDSILASEFSDAVVTSASGTNGNNGASTNWVFHRSATAPNTPTANGLNVPYSNVQWYDSPPAGTTTLWASKGFAAVGALAYVWGAVFQVEGSVVAELKVYSDVVASNGSSPAKPSNGQSKFNSTNGTLTINNASWNLAPPSITNNGDTIYACNVLLQSAVTDTNVSITWSTPTIYARKTDGTNAINSRYPTLYRLNSASRNDSSGTFADPLDNNTSWSYSVPGMTANGDVVYAMSRIFTSDGSVPQTDAWPAAAVYARRVDGTTISGVGTRQVNLYKLNDSTITSNTFGSFTNPISGVEAGWGYAVPAVGSNNDKVYLVSRIFTSNGSAPQTTTWTAPVIYSQRTDGNPGPRGNPGAAGNTGAAGTSPWTIRADQLHVIFSESGRGDTPSAPVTQINSNPANTIDIIVYATNGTTNEQAHFRGTANTTNQTVSVSEHTDSTNSFSKTIYNNNTDGVSCTVTHDTAPGSVIIKWSYVEVNIASACFIASTLVCMEDGTVQAISEINEGDLVLGKSETNQVLKNHPTDRHFERIYGFNGLGCFTTHNHAFLTTEGWKCISKEAALEVDGEEHYKLIVGELQVGDTIIGFNDSDTIVLTSIDSRPSRPNDFPVYNLYLDGDHTYFADFLCVHNKG